MSRRQVIYEVEFRSRHRGTLTFTLEYWDIPHSSKNPILRKTSTIITEETITNWNLYVIGNLSEERIGRAQPVSFSGDLQFLRIGAALFQADADDEYILILYPSQSLSQYPSYIEEFESQRGLTVLTARQQIYTSGGYTLGLDNRKVTGIGRDFLIAEQRLRDGSTGAGYDYDDDSDSDSSDSEIDLENDAEESLSEASSNEDSDSDIADDLITPWTRPPVSYGEDQTSATSEDDGDSDKDSESDESQIPVTRVFNWGDYVGDSDSEDGWYIERRRRTFGSDSESVASEQPERKKSRPSFAKLVLLGTTSNGTKKLFEFSYPLRYSLYASPPVIHPSWSLVVWPLSGGEVLFGDFARNKYFTRRLRPSTSSSKLNP